MTETNVQLRQPAKLDYASPIQFRFKCTKLPEVEFTCQTANIPDVSMPTTEVASRWRNLPIVPGGGIAFGYFTVRFIVDEDLENYMQIQNWMRGLGYPESLNEIDRYVTYVNKPILGKQVIFQED